MGAAVQVPELQTVVLSVRQISKPLQLEAATQVPVTAGRVALWGLKPGQHSEPLAHWLESSQSSSALAPGLQRPASAQVSSPPAATAPVMQQPELQAMGIWPGVGPQRRE